MHFPTTLLAITASFSTASAVYQGFNYGATTKSGTVKMQSDFEAEFAAAKKLPGTNGAYTSARLYTMIQGGSDSDPISAIPAAISQDTKILLGMWASGGQAGMNNEIKALQNAITKYGSDFTSRVIGLSVGSEDLYRVTPTSFANDPNSVGAGPDIIVSYIKQVRLAIAGTALSSVPVGHVDTWTAWVNGSNSAVAKECDWVGMNTFPYFQTTDSNSIDDASKLFFNAVSATAGAAGKPVWITETGWPVVGKLSNLAVASAANAKTYYDAVGCKIFGTVNTFWYSLVDDNSDPTQPEFGILGTSLTANSQLIYDLQCPAVSSTSAAATTAAATQSSVADVSSAISTGASALTTLVATQSASGLNAATATPTVARSTSTGGATVATAISYGGAIAGILAVVAAF